MPNARQSGRSFLSSIPPTMLIAIHCENFANLGKLGGHHDEVAFSHRWEDGKLYRHHHHYSTEAEEEVMTEPKLK